MKPCMVCQTETSNRCEGCHEAHYCCREHQTQEWKAGHKRSCRGKGGGAGAKGEKGGGTRAGQAADAGAALSVDFAALMSPAESRGMSELDKYEWFVDCYSWTRSTCSLETHGGCTQAMTQPHSPSQRISR
ncbi:hypothetical protein T484DRAFT_1924247 [Baffinella frigidus]|nr:hypothetical protein T484DRAFT_1924247 [Cryptophyta sp. CCMP2293]